MAFDFGVDPGIKPVCCSGLRWSLPVIRPVLLWALDVERAYPFHDCPVAQITSCQVDAVTSNIYVGPDQFLPCVIATLGIFTSFILNCFQGAAITGRSGLDVFR
jgi:hypothetical protein